MNDDDIPISTHQGEFTLFGVTLHCHVLSDGQRVIEADDINRLFEAMAEPCTMDVADVKTAVEAFARWVRGR
jgi:hypothetical protein